jgi:hypothetical protein
MLGKLYYIVKLDIPEMFYLGQGHWEILPNKIFLIDNIYEQPSKLCTVVHLALPKMDWGKAVHLSNAIWAWAKFDRLKVLTEQELKYITKTPLHELPTDLNFTIPITHQVSKSRHDL